MYTFSDNWILILNGQLQGSKNQDQADYKLMDDSNVFTFGVFV